jgi:endonuclease YncB( thermonuclease family)
MALRALLDGKSITYSFKHISVPPKAICSVENSDVVQFLLSEGWAELAEGTRDKAYVEASEFAQSRGAGIWGDGPP